ncbi:hypothetical protein VNO78_26656 [Psophocarpus tetragonolobus]|uniref:Uncharacterized protein n=1 Tax=Psophocarpus tetragonolobus TaxID=3891 RepID=A0AAN9RZX6_PSOTE
MTNKGRGGGRKPPNHGRGHGASWRPPVTTSSVHISTTDSTIVAAQQGQGSLLLVQEFVISTNAEGSIPPSRDPTPECLPFTEFAQPIDSRFLLQERPRSELDTTNIQPIFEQHRNSENFKNKSTIAKVNQAIDKGALTYCGGSISIIVHYEKPVTLHINSSI